LLEVDSILDSTFLDVTPLSHRLAEDGSSGGALGVLLMPGRRGSGRVFIILWSGSEVERFARLRSTPLSCVLALSTTIDTQKESRSLA
jgi:hypothetical protein